MNKTVAIVIATALVALTPVFAYADAGPKTKASIDDAKLLSEVQTLMDNASANSFQDDNHGGIVSWATHNFDQLLSTLGLKAGEKVTRGQIISAIATSDAGKSNEGKADADTTPEVKKTPTAEAASNEHGKGKSNQAKGKGEGENDDEAVTNSAATAVPTATATPVPTASATAETTATPVPTTEERGHRGGPNR